MLYAPDSRQGQPVVCCSSAAERLGVRSGMPLSQATAILEQLTRRGGSVVVRAFSPDEDRAALQELARFCGQFSPLVGHTTLGPDGPWMMDDGLLWDVSATVRLFGGERHLLEQAARAIGQRWPYRGRWAVGPTVAAAWAWARYGMAWQGQEGRTVAAVVEPERLWTQVGPLPIAALRLAPSIERCLATLGIQRIEQLAAVAAEALTERFGPRPTQRLRQLTGELEEAIVPVKELPVFAAEQWLEFPTASRAVVEHITGRLMEQVARRLAAQQLGALELELQLDCQAAARTFPLRIALFEPTARADYWQQLARMQFEQAPLPAAVCRIALRVVRTAKLPVIAGELFATHISSAEASQQLAQLIDRLAARLGTSAVCQPYLTSDHQPERAYRTRPFRKLVLRPGEMTGSSLQPPPAVPRPLILHQPPLPLDVMAVVPEGPPIRCHSAKYHFTVARWWGPERIETGWWRGASVRRDYYHVESETGQHFWIFRRLGDGRWFLQGEFS